MTCREALRAVQPYVDGELEPSHMIEVEGHLDSCGSCSSEASFQRMMKRAVRAESALERPSPSLRDRILKSAEQERQVAIEQARTRDSWKRAIPWAAAAAVAIGIGSGASVLDHASMIVPAPNTMAAKLTSASPPAEHTLLLDEFAAYHARPLPPEQVDPTVINAVFSPIVGVPVRPSRVQEGFIHQHRAYTFSGARLMLVEHESAATLSYNLAGKRVTVFVFDAQRIRLRSQCCLSPRVVNGSQGDRTVLLGNAHGYPLAAFEREGVGYAVSADMTDSDLLEIAANL